MGCFKEYPTLDAVALGDLVRSGEISPLELVEEAEERIAAIDPSINAVVHRLFDDARDVAKGPLPIGPRAPLAGVPFLLKDLSVRLAGVPLSNGSRLFKGFVPEESTAIASRFLGAGLVIVGKTNTPELGLLPTTEPVLWGPTHNPWDPSRTPGGSSGGSAAAVAARMVPAASGSDGGGSIRIPASCCGVFGLKPTRGRTPTGPLRAEQWNGFSCEHALTVSVRDSAALLDAIAGPLTGDLYSLPAPEVPFLEQLAERPEKLRIAFTDRPLLTSGSIHEECRAGLESTVRLLEELGHEVIHAAPFIDHARFRRSYAIVVSAQTHADIEQSERELGRTVRFDDLEQSTRLSAKLGAAVTAGEYLSAVRTLQRIARDVLIALEGFDAYLCPTLAVPPPRLGFLKPRGFDALASGAADRLPLEAAMKTDAAIDRATSNVFAIMPFTPVFNVTGQPSMSVPLHWTAEGLPVGMMFSGRLGEEATLLRLARQLEEARPWRGRLPPVSEGGETARPKQRWRLW